MWPSAGKSGPALVILNGATADQNCLSQSQVVTWRVVPPGVQPASVWCTFVRPTRVHLVTPLYPRPDESPAEQSTARMNGHGLAEGSYEVRYDPHNRRAPGSARPGSAGSSHRRANGSK